MQISKRKRTFAWGIKVILCEKLTVTEAEIWSGLGAENLTTLHCGHFFLTTMIKPRLEKVRFTLFMRGMHENDTKSDDTWPGLQHI